MVQRRPAAHRLRRGRAHVAVERRLLRHRATWSAASSTTRRARARSSVSCRACASTRSPSASRREIQKVRRTGLTFAPEAGTWRMRQVINKLITEEDLYGAVESAFSQGWRRVKLYFLTGLPTEMDEDTLGIAELAAQLRRRSAASTPTGRASPHRSAASCPSRRRRSSGSARTRVRRAAPQDRAARDATRKAKRRQPQVARPQGHPGRGHRQPRRPPHRARSSRRCGATAARSRSGREHFDLDAVGRRHGRRTGSSIDWYVHRHRTEDEVLPWDHISAGLHKDFLWQDWQDALGRARAPGLPVDALLRLRGVHRLRIEHVVASPVPPAGGSQGTGQDLVDRRLRCRSTLRRRPPARSGAMRVRAPVHQAGQGPLGPATAMWPACSSGPSGRVSCRSPTPPGSRPGPRSASAWPSRPAPSHWPSTSTSRSTDTAPAVGGAAPIDASALPALLTPALPTGVDVVAAARHRRGRRLAPARGHVVPRGRFELVGVARRGRRCADSTRHWPPKALVIVRERKGTRRSTTTSVPAYLPQPSSDGAPTATLVEAETGHPAPRCPPHRAAGRPRLRAAEAARVRRTHQWIQRERSRGASRSTPTAAPTPAGAGAS